MGGAFQGGEGASAKGQRVNRADLEAIGFSGWTPLISVEHHPHLPRQPGVYAVAYPPGRPKQWPTQSCGGWYRGDPAIAVHRLDQRWVDASDIVYIGKTDRTLAQRITEFARFGNGMPVAHWGGRLIWQLPLVPRLLIGWRTVEAGQAVATEAALLAAFFHSFGRLPFANLRR